jgi:hypothetical protein
MTGDTHVFGDDAVQVARFGQFHRRHQTGVRHEVGIVKRYAEPAATVE